MSFSTGCRKCEKCGKMYLISGLCAECEKAEQTSKIIEELENMPCITPEEMQKCKDIVKKYTPKQEPCDDVVSRQAVLDIVCGTYEKVGFGWGESNFYKAIQELPSVRPQEPKWNE